MPSAPTSGFTPSSPSTITASSSMSGCRRPKSIRGYWRNYYEKDRWAHLCY
jgi:hypothetical protein